MLKPYFAVLSSLRSNNFFREIIVMKSKPITLKVITYILAADIKQF